MATHGLPPARARAPSRAPSRNRCRAACRPRLLVSRTGTQATCPESHVMKGRAHPSIHASLCHRVSSQAPERGLTRALKAESPLRDLGPRCTCGFCFCVGSWSKSRFFGGPERWGGKEAVPAQASEPGGRSQGCTLPRGRRPQPPGHSPQHQLLGSAARAERDEPGRPGYRT